MNEMETLDRMETELKEMLSGPNLSNRAHAVLTGALILIQRAQLEEQSHLNFSQKEPA